MKRKSEIADLAGKQQETEKGLARETVAVEIAAMRAVLESHWLQRGVQTQSQMIVCLRDCVSVSVSYQKIVHSSFAARLSVVIHCRGRNSNHKRTQHTCVRAREFD